MVYQQFYFPKTTFSEQAGKVQHLTGGGREWLFFFFFFQSIGSHKSYFHRLLHKMYLGLAETYAHPNLQNVPLIKGGEKSPQKF